MSLRRLAGLPVLPRVSAVVAALALTILAQPVFVLAAQQQQQGLELVPLPDWVHPVELDLDSAAEAEDVYGIAQLLQEHHYNFLGEQVRTFQRMVFDLRTRTAIEALSVVRVPLQPKSQTNLFHRLGVWRDGTFIDMSDGAVVQTGDASAALPDLQNAEQTTQAIFLPDIRVGDILEVSVSTQGHVPGLAGTKSAVVGAAGLLPLGRFVLRVLDSEETPVWLHVRGDGIAIATRSEGQVRERRVDRQDIPALTIESGVPNWYPSFPQVAITGYEDWNGVLAWARPLFALSGEGGGTVAAKARDLVAGASGEREKFDAIAAFVQERIRYLGPGLSRNGYVPFEPADVLRRRWGDCKDKVMLMLTMLDAVGIRARAALTNIGEGHVDPAIPSPLAFDHVVVLAEIGGSEVWLDATGRAIAEGRPSPEPPAANLALPVGDGEAELLEVPHGEVGPEGYHVDMLAEFDLREDGHARFSVAYAGAHAENVRRMVEVGGAGTVGEYYLSQFAKAGEDMEMDGDARVAEHPVLNVLNVAQDLRARTLWKKEGRTKFRTFKSVPDRILQFVAGKPAADLERKAPVALPWPLAVRERHVLTLPDDMDLDPYESVIERDAYRLAYAWERNDHVLTLTTEYRTFRDHLLPEEIDTWRLDREALVDWSYTVWTNPPPPAEPELQSTGADDREADAAPDLDPPQPARPNRTD